MTTTVSVALNGLTFGDLYDFVDLARRAGVPRETEVSQEYDMDDQSGPHTLEVHLSNLDAVRNLDLAGLKRDEVIEVLDAVLSTGGDARGALDEIKVIRDQLV